MSTNSKNSSVPLMDGTHFYDFSGATTLRKREKKSHRFLLILLVVSTCAFFFTSCEFFGGGENGNGKGGNSRPSDTVSSEPNLDFQELEEGMELLSDRNEVFKPNPKNSPGNPAFIDVSFTDEEYETSPAYVAEVSTDTPEADFVDDGIHVNLKSYNLHNDSDRLFLEVMPVKTDPTYGNQLYTYNFWMESGQSQFGTEVELTLPIHNGEGTLRNVLYHNWETGEWEELYYTIADDGKTCTAYIDHFSEIATEEANAQDAVESAKKALNYYGSVFIEGEGGDKDYHATDGVGLVSTPDFFKIVQRQTESAKGVFDMLNKGGGIPSDSKLIEGLDSFGRIVDLTSSAIVLGQAVKLISNSWGADMFGMAITYVGYCLLNTRILDMKLRGVEPKRIEEENRWGQTSIIISFSGNLASFLGMSTISAVCSWVCVAIFAGSVAYSISQNYVSKVQPFGKPTTIEEGAYHQYFRTPTTDVLKKLGIQSNVPITGTGKGWADAFNAIFKDSSILDAKEKCDKMVALYNTYINYFWTDLSEQDQRNYWRAYIDFAAEERWMGDRYNFPSKEDEQARLISIIDKAKMIQRIGDLGAQYRPMSDEDFASLWREIKFDSDYIRASQKDYKHRAMEALTQNTNSIIYDLIKKEYHATIMDARKRLQNDVLPTLNAVLYFYAEDQSLGQNELINKSRYYGYNPVTKETDPKKMCKMDFKCDKNKPLFNSANTPAPWYGLYLQPEINSTRLGRCNVYHYLQYGAPQEVDITSRDNTLKNTTGNVDLSSGVPYRIMASYGGEEYGFRVPVRFNDKEDKKLNSVDIKMRIYADEMTRSYYKPEEIIEEFGNNAEAHLFPKDVHVVVKKDGTTTIDMPAVTNFQCKDYYNYKLYNVINTNIFDRNMLSLKGQVVKVEDRVGKDDEPYTLYIGFLSGDYTLTNCQTSISNKNTTCTETITLNNTKKYHRDGKTVIFSKFLLFYCPKDGHYELAISLVGDYENVKLPKKFGKDNIKQESPYNYFFQLTTELDGSLDKFELTDDVADWK